MPQTTKWYDGKIDPTLPSEIKPILYYYDEYQTYDLIINYLDLSFYAYTLIPIMCKYGNGYFPLNILSKNLNVKLIERYSPLNVPVILLDNYSYKLSDFLKIFNNYAGRSFQTIFDTRIYDITATISINPLTHIFTMLPANVTDLDWDSKPFISPVRFDDKYEFIIDFDEYIDITDYEYEYLYIWYLKQDEQTDFFTSYTWQRKNIKGQKFWPFIDLIEPFSVYIESDNQGLVQFLESKYNEKSLLYLFSNLDSGLEHIKTKIKLDHDFSILHETMKPDESSEFYQEIKLYDLEFYTKSIFIQANNNYWNSASMPTNNNDTTPLYYYDKSDTVVANKFRKLTHSLVYTSPEIFVFPYELHTNLFQWFDYQSTVRSDSLWTYTYPLPDKLPQIIEGKIMELAENKYYDEEYTEEGEKEMPDSIRIKEIHTALNAGKFAVNDDDPEKDRIANLGYYIERIARVNGISVNSDGSIRSIRNAKRIEQDQVIPAGWNFGQFGLNEGGTSDGQLGGEDGEIRDGIVYELKSNYVDKSGLGKATIKAGGYVLCENTPQYIHVLMQDLDKALSLQEMGAFPLPTPDNKDYVVYEGIHSLIADLAFMVSRLSDNIIQSHVLGLKNNALLLETLRATGVAISEKRINIKIDNQNTQIVSPAVAETSLTITDFLFQILQNLSLIVGSHVTLKTEESEG